MWDFLYVGSERLNNVSLHKISADDGSLVWSVDAMTHAYGVCADPDGFVYTGNQKGDLGDGNKNVRRFTPAGVYNLGALPIDHIARTVAVDTRRNIYGGTTNVSSQSVFKIDPDGNTVWTFEHDERMYSVRSGINDVVVSAGYRTSNKTAYKINATTGAEIWSADHGANLRSVGIDIDGNVYVGGIRTSDITHRKYDTNGNPVWSADHGADLEAESIDTDQTYIYIGGNQVSNDSVRKLRQSDGGVEWSGAVYNNSNARGIFVDPDGNVYAGRITSGQDGYVTKFDSDGNKLWEVIVHTGERIRSIAGPPGAYGAGFWNLIETPAPERFTPALIAEITQGAAVYRYTCIKHGVYIDDVWYDGKITDHFAVRESLSEQFYGFSRFEDLTLSLSNAGGIFTDLYAAADLRGADVVLARVDLLESGGEETIWRVWGRVTQFAVQEGAEPKAVLHIALNRDLEPLDKNIPAELVDTSITWENEETPAVKAAYERDLGKPVNIIFGHARQVPVPLVNNDFDVDKYDYLIGGGPDPGAVTESNNTNKDTTVTVYRDERIVLPAEFTFYDGSQASPYPGKAFIRFSIYQQDFSGQLHTFAADVRGFKLSGSTAERNFVRCIEHLLKNTAWGLSESVDASSFDAAAALAAITSRYCDGAVATQRKALDVLNELLFCAQARLWKDPASGAWKIAVDQPSYAVMTLYQGSEGHQDNIIEVERVWKENTKDAIKTLKFQYFRDGFSNEWKLTTEPRTVNSGFGVDKVETLPWVNDQETADRIACYHAKLRQYSDEWVELSVGQEARYLQVAHVVTLDVPRLGLSGLYRIVEIERAIDRYNLVLCSYDHDIFSYDGESLPDDPDSPYPVDWSKTPPSAPTLVGVIGMTATAVAVSGRQGVDNPENFSHIEIRLLGPGYDRIQIGYKFLYTGWGTTFDNVIDGQDYTYEIISVNKFGLRTVGATDTFTMGTV